MSPDPCAAGSLAARRLLRRRNPGVLAWSERQWRTWLSSEAGARPTPESWPMLIVAALSCMDDLPLHVGVMQLLGLPGLRCTLVLSLPTEAIARLVRAQARREGWDLLTHIVDQDTCTSMLSRLRDRDALAVFPHPAALAPEALEFAAALATSSENLAHALVPQNSGAFLGHAAQHSNWTRARDDAFWAQRAQAVTRLLSLETDTLGEAPPRAKTPSSSVQVTCAARLTIRAEDTVDVPELGHGDELLVSVAPDSADSPVLVRQRADLILANPSLRVRVPPRILTTTAHRIRIERRTSGTPVSGSDLLLHVPPAHLKPWMMSAFLNRGGAGNPVMRAFAEGIGCRTAYAEDEPEVLRDIPAVWGVLRHSDRLLEQAKAQSLYFFYIDHAYFDRGHGKSYRITRNAYEAGPVRHCPRDRLASLALEVAPWRKGGTEIIVCPPTEYFMKAHGCADWLETTMDTLRSLTDRPIVVREKPKAGESSMPLPQALATAHALVTHSSNVAIEAACLGTPVFVSPTSAAAPVGRTDLAMIETPAYPDREPWLAHLAYNQFSFDEIRSGTAWRLLLELEEREYV